MKIAIQNPFAGQPVAETELARRIVRAAEQLGWQAIEAHTAAELRSVAPDFVIALHNNDPKLAEFPTYGCLWNPPSFFEGTDRFVQHVLSYDGYLSSGGSLDRWLHQLLLNTAKPYFVAPFYTSCPATVYQPPDLAQPRLLYLGSNWDGQRFQPLFEALDRLPNFEVYGRAENWQFLRSSYRRALPFDGVSVFETLRRAGVGLCLHRAEHVQAGVPSMRIFEIVAAGAVAICGDHPFIRAAFGETVLYFDETKSIAKQAEQIQHHLHWIASHPAEAQALTLRAHQIFSENYTLEKLLEAIADHHHCFHATQTQCLTQSSSAVTCLLIDRQTSISSLSISLESLASQIYAHLAVLLISDRPDELQTQLSPFLTQLNLKIIKPDSVEYFSSLLWFGLRQITTPYFCLLSDGDRIYPNHVLSLVNLLETHSAKLAYAGAIDRSDSRKLIGFEPQDFDRFLADTQPIASSSFLARSSLLKLINLNDPQLETIAEYCLLLYLYQHTNFLFSHSLTCEIVSRAEDPSEFWQSERSRLNFIFRGQVFPNGKSWQALCREVSIDRASIAALQAQSDRLQSQIQDLQARSQAELQDAQAEIAAMKTSKFWRLRTRWLRLKQAIGSTVQLFYTKAK